MKFHLARVLSRVHEGLLLGLVFLLPLFFLPWTLDVLEVNKQTLLLIVTSLAVLCFVGRVLHEREVTLVSGWQNVLPLLVLAVTFLSALFSIGGATSWLGGSSVEYQSVFTITALTALFYLLTHTIRKETLERRLFAVLLLSGSLVLLLSCFNLFGASLFPWTFLQGPAFNTVGTVNALGVFAVVISVLGQALWLVSGRKDREVFLDGWKGSVEKGLIVFLTISTLLLLLALDFWALWVLVLVGSGMLFLFGLLRASEFPETNRFILPMAFVIVAVFFLFLPRPFRLSLPVEVTPSISTSWNIVEDTWSEHSMLLGSGSGTYAFDYARFRSADVNQTVFWNTRFDRGHSYALTVLATLGILGGMALLLMVLGLLAGSLRVLLKERDHVIWKLHFVLLSAWTTLGVSAFLYSWNLTLQFLFFVLSALLASQSLRGRTVKLRNSPRVNLTFSFLFVLFSIGMLTLLFVSVERQMAESAFAKAVRLDRSRVSIDEVIVHLDRAVTLNQFNDTYQRNLSQALLYRANELVMGRSNGMLSEDDTKRLASLSSASINSAKRATDLSPYNVLNWRVRADVYRELMSLVSGADQFAKLSYERAILLEPNHPEGPTGLARVHLAGAIVASQLAGSEDATTRKEALQKKNGELASAEEQLNRAIELKPDYAPAHFYLALVYEEQGKLNEAFAKLDAIRKYNPADVGVAFQLGQLAMRLERYDRAKSEFESAIKLQPDFLNAHWFLASVYEIEGDLDSAIAEIQFIQKTEPEHPLVVARLKRLLEGKVKASLPEPLEEGEEVVVP